MNQGKNNGGLHCLNGRGYLAHALESELSPPEWAFFAYYPREHALGIEPGSLVTWTLQDGQADRGIVAGFEPEGDGFWMRVSVLPGHLRLEALAQACGEPIPLDLAPLPPQAEAPRLPALTFEG